MDLNSHLKVSLFIKWAAALLIMLFSMPGTCLSARTDAVSQVLVIEAYSDRHDYHDAIASVALPDDVNIRQPLVLIDNETGSTIPHQIETLPDGNSNLIWFIVVGHLPAQTARRFTLYHDNPVTSRNLKLETDHASVRLKKNGHTILQYNHAHIVPPAGIDPHFTRSGYIHPVYSPSGLLVTEDFPESHRHHKGVWFPWTHTKFQGRILDFWNLAKEEATVQFAGFKNMFAGSVFIGFKALHEFIDLTQSDGVPVLNETWDVRAWNTDNAFTLWDLTSTQYTATNDPIELLEYRYGGLGFRGPATWEDENHIVLTSEGHTKADGNAQRARWVAQSGEIVDGRPATVIIMSHPENYRFPEPIRIWDTGGSFFNYSPIQLGSWRLDAGGKYAFRYRFLVYDGEIDRDFAERMWQQFASPLPTRIISD